MVFVISAASVSVGLVIFILILMHLSASSSKTRRLENLKHCQENVDLISGKLDALVEKSVALGSAYEEERQKFSSIGTQAKELAVSESVEVAKFDYELLTKITQVDFLCDKALAGTVAEGDFMRELLVLEDKLRQRVCMELN